MKIAIVYNHESKNVINLFGLPNREKYGLKAIQRIVNGLRKFKHQVVSLEADKDLIPRLEEFMPRVLKGERPGMVFNLSYGIQGQARYTHVPGILEMMGIPYVGSGPLAHSLALDKVVAKMIFLQNGVPTPEFTVLTNPVSDAHDLTYPLIVKPKNESISMGIRIVNNEQELREASQNIFENFHNQPVLVERYIDGREINVGLIGNNPPDVLPPCEIVFGNTGPQIYTIEDKKGESGREIQWRCPAEIGDDLIAKSQEIAKKAFAALGCYDAARVDMRLDKDGNLYVLEINSLPSLGEHGSYVIAAEHAGLDFSGLVNRLVEVASARYFGTPTPPSITPGERDPEKLIFSFITQRRDRMEKRLAEWTAVSSHTTDPVGNSMAIAQLEKSMLDVKMKPVKEFTDPRSVWTWKTEKGFKKGTLLIAHSDIPLQASMPVQGFRRDPEWLYGEGIGISRAPLVMTEYILRALRYCRILHNVPMGVLVYMDEGRDCRYSSEIIKAAASEAARVFILRPGGLGDTIRTQRRGQRKFSLTVEGEPRRIGQQKKTQEVLLWFNGKMAQLFDLSSPKKRLSLSPVDVKVDSFPMRLPHRITATLVLSYLDTKTADECEAKMKEIMNKRGYRWSLERISDRPPMRERRNSLSLAKSLITYAKKWDINIEKESSVMPSAAGLVPASVPVVCGVAPVGKEHYTPQEAIQRVSLVQRTLLMAEYLAQPVLEKKKR